jgi:hypothetical protein
VTLRVSWEGQWKSGSRWVVVEERAVCELIVESTEVIHDEALNVIEPSFLLDDVALNAQISRVPDAELPPDTAAAWKISVRPLPEPRFRSAALRIAFGASADAPLFSLSLVPGSQARWCRRVVWLTAGLCLFLLWPLHDLSPSQEWEQGFRVAFGVLPLGVAIDEVRRLWNEKAIDGVYGLKPSALYHALLALPLIWGAYLVAGCGATLQNATEHEIPVQWHGGEHSKFEPGARHTLLSGDPAEAFEARRVRNRAESEVASGTSPYCLAPSKDCPLSDVADSGLASWFRLTREFSVQCRPVEWIGLDREELAVSGLERAERRGGKVFLRANKEDCSPLEASAWVDPAALFGKDLGLKERGQARARIGSTGVFAAVENGAGAAFLQTQLTLQVVQLGSAERESRLALRVVGSDEAPYREATFRLNPAPSSSRVAAGPLPLPVELDSYRFLVEVGPPGASAWGQVTCYPRGASSLTLWLLPLKDSVVRRAQVSSSGGEVLSVWNVAESAERSGERADVLPICLPGPAPAEAGAMPSQLLRFELTVPDLGGGADLPQLELPSALAHAEIRVNAEQGTHLRRLGTMTCNRSEAVSVRRMPAIRASTVEVRGTGDTKSIESSWIGSEASIVCLPSGRPGPFSVKTISASGGTSTCKYSLAGGNKGDKCEGPPTAPPCLVNKAARKVESCACAATDRAKKHLGAGLMQEVETLYSCDSDTALLCPCEP